MTLLTPKQELIWLNKKLRFPTVLFQNPANTETRVSKVTFQNKYHKPVKIKCWALVPPQKKKPGRPSPSHLILDYILPAEETFVLNFASANFYTEQGQSLMARGSVDQSVLCEVKFEYLNSTHRVESPQLT